MSLMSLGIVRERAKIIDNFFVLEHGHDPRAIKYLKFHIRYKGLFTVSSICVIAKKWVPLISVVLFTMIDVKGKTLTLNARLNVNRSLLWLHLQKPISHAESRFPQEST